MRKTCLLMMAVAVLLFTACVDDLTPDSLSRSGETTLVFSVSEGMPATRAVEKAGKNDATGPERANATIDFGKTEDGKPLRFEHTVTWLNTLASGPLTKGTPATSANVGSLYRSFTAIAYDGTSRVSIDGSNSFDFSYSNGKWSHEFRSDPWAGHSNMFFFMYMPVLPEGTVFDPSEKTISFNYTVEDASTQEDLLFGGRLASKSEYVPSTGFPVLFHHALCGVKFAIGNDANSTVIKTVTLKNIVKAGSVVIRPASESGSYVDNAETHSSKTAVAWRTPDSSEKTNYTLTVPSGTYASGDNLNYSDLSLTFWMIPQTLSSDAELEITYTIGGGDKRTVSVGINTALGETQVWQAGELHTFTLNVGDVDVSITDTVSEGVKNNVVITNTGNVAAYLRAVIVANWQDAKGNIVAAWEPESGTFAGLPGTGWTLAADGYYYSSDTIAPGENAPALFTSYTPPSTPPVAGAHLVMDIAVQAVNSKPGSWAE